MSCEVCPVVPVHLFPSVSFYFNFIFEGTIPSGSLFLHVLRMCQTISLYPARNVLSTAVSSTSSYAPSSVSFSFTLCSNTDTSSAGSALFEKKEPGSDAFVGQLKQIYQNITAFEDKIENKDGMGSYKGYEL